MDTVNLMAWFKELFISNEVAEDITVTAGGQVEEWNADAAEFNKKNKRAIKRGEYSEMRECDSEDIQDYVRQGWHDYWVGVIDGYVNDKWAVGELFYLDDENTTLVMLMVASPEEDGCKWQVAGDPRLLTTWELFEETSNPQEEWFDEELSHPRNKHWVRCYTEMGVIW